MQRKLGTKVAEGANTRAVRGLMIGLAALVVLTVSGYGTVIYIQLMSKVFPPGGPLLVACYMGAMANLLLMLILLVGKFTWFRPGAHEVASWIVTGVELLVAILNMMLAYQLASGQRLENLMLVWYQLAPISPVFSMVGAIVLIMTSAELRKRHKQQEMEDEKELAEHELELAMHRAHLGVRTQYLEFVQSQLKEELNAPQRQAEIAHHANKLVTQVLTEMSGLPALYGSDTPQLSVPRTVDVAGQGLPPVISPSSFSRTEELDQDDSWFGRVNERVARMRQEGFLEDGDGTPKDFSLADGQAQEVADAVVRLMKEVREGLIDLGEVEQLLGLGSHWRLSFEERVLAVVRTAFARGYDLDQLKEIVSQKKKVAEGDDWQESSSRATLRLKYRSL